MNSVYKMREFWFEQEDWVDERWEYEDILDEYDLKLSLDIERLFDVGTLIETN
jgi:hypothetical protein